MEHYLAMLPPCVILHHLIDSPASVRLKRVLVYVSPAVPVHPLVLSQCTLPTANVLMQGGFINHYAAAIGAGSRQQTCAGIWWNPLAVDRDV